ncbi:MAG TPA: hypothetical protein VHA56_22080 [Mucilaginibacter sp.]|nr:hypothetical protein [Mucilaginibacter sp.]
MKWKDKLISDLMQSCGKVNNHVISDVIKKVEAESISIHLAIFNEPFLTLIFEKKKTMESRFSINYVAPYRKVSAGDLILVKKPGGAICGFFVAGKVLYFSNLNATKIKDIENQFGKQLCWNIDPEFLSNKAGAKYLSIIEITDLTKVTPIEIQKSDRTAWSVIKLGLQNTLFS